MTRLGGVLLAAAAAGFIGSLAVGAPQLSVVFLVAGLGILRGVRTAGAVPVAEASWSAPDDAGGVTSTWRERPGPAIREIAKALGRVEARELATNPWFGVGIGFCVLMVLAFSTEQDDSSWIETIESLPFLAHPLVGMTVVASFRNATRVARDGVGELLDACPTTSDTRTVGVLASSWVSVAVLATFFGAYAVAGAAFSEVHGEPGSAAIPIVLAGLVLGAGGVALGVALGRWVLFALAPVIAVVAVGFVSVRLADAAGGKVTSRMLFSTMPPLGDPAPGYTAAQAWLHLAWLVAITAATGAVALAGGWRRGTVPSVAAPSVPDALTAGATP